ncbi:hypothetical protein GQ55_7G322600 [Panicum hallii var. hallii]|uniref:Uncharacterized protein n=1 Tax=Panicum hallii var. hallii TaxID=1504633 RepID=A0A2T7D1B0_9POAL|nr:hypothetical protein GQ55_7G322600 [Panicum hallii var. hallii]
MRERWVEEDRIQGNKTLRRRPTRSSGQTDPGVLGIFSSRNRRGVVADLGSLELEARGSHTCPRPARRSPPRLERLSDPSALTYPANPSQILAPCPAPAPARIAGGTPESHEEDAYKTAKPGAQSEEGARSRSRRRSGEGTPPAPPR